MRVLVAFVALLAACTTSSGYPVPLENPAPLSRSAISEVFVSIDEKTLAQDRVDAFRSHGGSGRVHDAIAGRLTKSGLIDPTSPATLHVDVVAFRLRSTGTSLWVGSMAGDDSLSVEATVKINDEPVRKYIASASSLRGGIFFPGSGGRFSNLADRVAKELAGQLSTDE